MAHSKQGIFISQQKYVLDLLTEGGKLAYKPVDTHIEFNHGLCDAPDDPMVDKRFVSETCWKVNLFGTYETRQCICSKCCQPIYAQL